MVLDGNVMKNCDTFIRHLYEWAAAESCSVNFLRQMLLLIAKRLCIPVSQAGKRTQTRRDSKGKTALDGAAPLLKAGAIGRSAQYIC